MAVLSYRELSGRSFQHRFGEAPTAEQRFAVTLDDPATTTQEILDSVNILHGDPHPEYAYLRCVEGNVSENAPDPWHAEITYRYELPSKTGQADLDPSPFSRPDIWSFSTGGAQVPALVYYDNGNQTYPLVNAAGDFFEGLTMDEAEVRASISGNRSDFDLALASAVTNAVNNAPYLGGAAHTWKCVGISGQQVTELINGAEENYWQVSVELAYRQSGWSLLLPHVGWHYIDGSDKKVCWVYSDDTPPKKIAAAFPQPLDTDGSLLYPGAGGMPDILTRRINPEVDFNFYFGTPPF